MPRRWVVGSRSSSMPRMRMEYGGYSVANRSRRTVGAASANSDLILAHGSATDGALVCSWTAEFRLVQDTEPGAVGLASADLGSGAGVVPGRRGSKGEVATHQRRQGRLRGEPCTACEHHRPQFLDRGPTDGGPSRRVGKHRVLLVERGDSLGVAGVGALDEQSSDVLRGHRLLTVRHGYSLRKGSRGRHHTELPPVRSPTDDPDGHEKVCSWNFGSWSTSWLWPRRRTSRALRSGCISASPGSARR